MDKNAIKKFAVWARTELIARVSLKGVECGITEDNIEDANADSVGGKSGIGQPFATKTLYVYFTDD